jgi:hypothetical protein
MEGREPEALPDPSRSKYPLSSPVSNDLRNQAIEFKGSVLERFEESSIFSGPEMKQSC